MEMVLRHPLGAGEVSRGEASQPETAAAQRQVLGAGVTVLMTVGKRLIGSGEREDGEETVEPRDSVGANSAQLKRPWYVERMLMKSRGGSHLVRK